MKNSYSLEIFFYFKTDENEATSTVYKSSPNMPKNIKCSPGLVPIKRATREDLMMAKSMKSFGLNYPTNTPFNGENDVPKGHHINKPITIFSFRSLLLDNL